MHPSVTLRWDRPDPPAPGLLRKAADLASAAVGFVADGLRLASPEVRDARERICLACPLFDRETSNCRKCGCYTPAKRAIAGSSCPDDPPRWEAV